MKVDITNKVALVTGANRGIGKAIVEGLVGAEAKKIYAAVRSLDSALPLVEEYGDVIVPLQLDLSNAGAIKKAADIASDTEILVSNAGILKESTSLASTAIDCLKEEMEINVYAFMRLAQAFAPVLKNNKGGAIVQLNSIVSLVSFPNFATYCASKAAAYSLTQALRKELEDQGTLVVSVHPGPINTDMAHSAGFTDIAEPPSLVSDAILSALKNGEFHVFPDTMARQMYEAYQGFAESVVLAPE